MSMDILSNKPVVVDDTTLSLKKRLIFRSWHRGTREMDIIMGRFADAHVMHFTPDQLDAYERLLVCNDPDVYDWIIGAAPVPAADDSDVVQMLLKFKVAQQA